MREDLAMNIELTDNTVLFAPTFYSIQQASLSVVIDPEWPNWIATDVRGAKILSLVDGRRTFREIIERYSQTYDVDWAKGWLHTHTFLKGAARADFVS